MQLRTTILVWYIAGDSFLNPLYLFRVISIYDWCITYPYEYIIMRSTTILVFLLPIKVIYFTKDFTFDNNFTRASNSKTKLLRTTSATTSTYLSSQLELQYQVSASEIDFSWSYTALNSYCTHIMPVLIKRKSGCNNFVPIGSI